LLEKKWEFNEVVHQLFIDIKKVYETVRREVVYNIPNEIGIPVKLDVIKMCLNEWYIRVWVAKHLSDMFPIRNALKQGHAISLLLFNFTLDYAIRRVQVNQDGLKLNGARQLLVYSDEVHILGGSVRTPKKNTTALLVGSKEIGLDVNSVKTKYVVMFRDQNVR
jgi:hypothetical protein